MPVEETSLPGLFTIRWETHDDERGFFRQTYQLDELERAVGRPLRWRQSNHARSRTGVLRGFHAEPWDKLVYITRGTALTAVLDIRPDSPTFGEVATFHLGDPPGERIRLFIPDGLAHAYCTYGGDVDHVYDVTEPWRPVDKRAIAWNDPDLDIDWPVEQPILSTEDRANPRLRDTFPHHPRFERGGSR